MITYRNTKTGKTVNLSEASPVMDRSKRWERVEDADTATKPGSGEASPAETSGAEGRAGSTPAGTASPEPFDPGAHTVDEVNEHLAAADQDERDRVLAAERAGKGRRGILEGPHADPSGQE